MKILFADTKQDAENYLSKKRTVLPNDLKREVADLAPNLNDSAEMDCISLSDDDVDDGRAENELIEVAPLDNAENELIEMAPLDNAENELIEAAPLDDEPINEFELVALLNVYSVETCTQTDDMQYCNVAAHRLVSSNELSQSILWSNKSTQTEKINSPSEEPAPFNIVTENSPKNLINTGMMTIASCNVTAHNNLFPSIPSNETATQTDFATIKLESALVAAKSALRNLNARLGDEVIATDSGSSIGDSDSTSSDDENGYDSSDGNKQLDNQFSLKYGFTTNVSET